MADRYDGWQIEVTVQADDLGDTTGADEAASYDAFGVEYQTAIEAAYPGADVSVRYSNNGGIRSRSERPRIVEPDAVRDDDARWLGNYEELQNTIQAIGEEVFERGTFWVVAEPI